MSGFPCKTQADVNKFRNEYMQTLAEQERINDMNLQANKNYLMTGELPPQSQIQDTRTNAEKLKDLEGLKQSIADELRPIAEPQFAYRIVNKVLNDPLNLDNSLFRFLAQRASSIAELLKKSYTFGIVGDANDLQIIVEFIKNMYSETQGKLTSTKSYLNSTINSYSSSSLISSNDISAIITQLQDVIKNITIGAQYNPVVYSQIERQQLNLAIPIINQIDEDLKALKSVLPTTQQVMLMLEDIDNPIFNNPYDMGVQPRNNFNAEELKSFYKFMEDLPKYNLVNTLITKILTYAKTSNVKLLAQGINNLREMFSIIKDFRDTPLYNKFKNIKDRQKFKQEEIQKTNEIQTIEDIKRDNLLHKEAVKAQKVYIVNPETDPVWTRMNGVPNVQPVINNAPNIRNIPAEIQPQPVRPAGVLAGMNDNPLFQRRLMAQANEYVVGNGVKRRGRPRGGGIVKQVLKKEPNFVGFGVNEINKKQLDKGILKIRRNTKSNYMDMPSRHISSNLQGILKTIIGGGAPKYEDLSKLDNEEKEYLHKVISRSSLADKLSVPAPSKDAEEKEIHKFEVMKGEIMSGNDNKDLVKNFKLLVVKLCNKGLLPKNEAYDVLETLASLGY